MVLQAYEERPILDGQLQCSDASYVDFFFSYIVKTKKTLKNLLGPRAFNKYIYIVLYRALSYIFLGYFVVMSYSFRRVTIGKG